MSRFYGSMQGNRGQATRQGTSKSGIEGHLRGWDVGARVTVHVNRQGEDEVCIYKTSGSSGSSGEQLITSFTESTIFAQL